MILRSKYIIDSFGQTTEDAEIVIDGNRIASIHKKIADRSDTNPETIDLGQTVLLPGFVNAHAHLELTAAAPHIEQHSQFTDWLREIVHTTSNWTEEDFNSSLRSGIKHCIDSGTTTLGDIGHMARDLRIYIVSGMRVRLFNEVIGFDPYAAREMFESLKVRIRECPSEKRLRIGIAPHTPYTVSEPLIRKCIELAHENDWPLCIHLAEAPAELEFLRKGTGQIRHFREEFGMPAQWTPPGVSPVRYLHHLGLFERPAVLIHCNHVFEEDFDILASSGSSVVFCPRSHRYFAQKDHPFIEMLGHGINVALGTDSLISSPTLSILDEMKFLWQDFPELEPAIILRMATANGLKALRFSSDIGKLEAGYQADIVGVELSEKEIGPFDSPLDAVLSAHSEVIFSMVSGKILFDSHCSRQ